MILSLLILAAGLFRESTVLIITGILLIGLFIYLVVITLWSLRQSNDLFTPDTVEALYKLSQTRTTEKLVCIECGLRWPAIVVSQHLTSGRLIVIDVYNPQLMPAKSLVRARNNAPPALTDPRITWYDSSLELLPLPDGSVNAVFLCHVLSELAQKGDQKALLLEIYRILEPDGRLLVAETADTWLNRLRPGSGITSIQPAEYWRTLLDVAGFEYQRSDMINGVTYVFRADKPSPYVGSQLSLGLDYEST